MSACGLVHKFVCSGFEPARALPSKSLVAVGAKNLQPAGCAEAFFSSLNMFSLLLVAPNASCFL